MSGIKKENERKKNQERRSEEGIIQRIFWKNIAGKKTTFSNRQLYNSFTLPLAASRGTGFAGGLKHYKFLIFLRQNTAFTAPMSLPARYAAC
ncbi:MAG: hypothetical protein DRG82_16515 [Deltaproteobacteria bacterium]|nr:MAG: hypothetical protein DRG82_16515 [Deltaproteobacteria bacterium]